MSLSGTLVFKTETAFGDYQVWDIVYSGRPARVLYSGNAQAAQSGIAKDDNPELLFDYNQCFYELVSAVLPSRLLLIGGGMYTLPMALLAALPSLKIDVVEIDEGLDAIAVNFFGLNKDDPRLRIIHTDGRSYLDHNKELYNMILVDAFTNTSIPSSLSSHDAANQFKRNLSQEGIIAANIISAYNGRGATIIGNHVESYEAAFRNVNVFPASRDLSLWLPQNLLVVACKGKNYPIHEYLRYQALSNPIR